MYKQLKFAIFLKAKREIQKKNVQKILYGFIGNSPSKTNRRKGSFSAEKKLKKSTKLL